MSGWRSPGFPLGARRAARQDGLTLIEVVVVLAIMGIAAAVTLPQLQTLLDDPTADVVRELTAAQRAAREAATVRGVAMTTVLELATGSYWVVAREDAHGVRDTIRQGTLPLEGQVRLSGGRAGWALTSFDPFGRARGTPLLVYGPDKTYEVSVDPRTGAIDARPR